MCTWTLTWMQSLLRTPTQLPAFGRQAGCSSLGVRIAGNGLIHCTGPQKAMARPWHGIRLLMSANPKRKRTGVGIGALALLPGLASLGLSLNSDRLGRHPFHRASLGPRPSLLRLRHLHRHAHPSGIVILERFCVKDIKAQRLYPRFCPFASCCVPQLESLLRLEFYYLALQALNAEFV